jgi:RimJ/RimL family protein N-acetyltransferase
MHGANGTPVIETARLELFRPQASDIDGIFMIMARPETRRHLGPTDASMADSFARLLRNGGSWSFYGYGSFIVRLKGQQGILGTCGIFRSYRGFGTDMDDKGMDDVPEAGWIINPDHWGKGYAREAMDAALAWFDAEHGPVRATCIIEEGHSVSERLAEALGFAAYDRHEPDDEPSPLILYERLPK